MKFFKKTTATLKRAVGTDMLKEQASFIKKMGEGIFKLKRSDRKDTFEDLAKIGIDEAQVQQAKESFKRMVVVFLSLALVVIFYIIYAILRGYFLTAVISVGVLAVCLAQAFKYHFWYFQIVERRLGCTVSEWWQYVKGILRK